jgi:hypothetical protein
MMCSAAIWTRLPRCRQRARTTQIMAGGRKLARSKPRECKVPEPLAVGDVRLASRHVLHVLCVDQVDFEAASLQDLIDRNPVKRWLIARLAFLRALSGQGQLHASRY